MANIDAPFGLNPVGKIGSGPSQKMNEYKIASNEANAIFQGDMVQPDAGYIQQAGTGTTNIGVFWGCKYDDATTNKPTFKNQSAASGNGAVADAFVYDDPYQVFEVQGDSGTASAQADIMQTADVVVGTGSTTTGISGMELDASDIGTGANLMIIGFCGNSERNQIDAAGHAVYNVLINEHLYT